MRYLTRFKLLTLSLLLSGVSAQTPPGGCYASVGILNIESPSFNSPVWTCTGIDPFSIFWSGQNTLYSSSLSTSLSSCGNQCATKWYGDLLMGALWFADNSTCQCWEIGFLSLDILPATEASEDATFINFYDVGVNGPSTAQKWGVFTCPEGPYTFVSPGSYGLCTSLSVKPAGSALAKLGAIGGCVTSCMDYGAEYIITDTELNCNCYGNLAGLKYYYNWSSQYIVVDIYDFTTTAKPSPTSKSSTKSTPKSTVTSTSRSSSKVTSKPSSTRIAKSTTKSTSHAPTPTTQKTTSHKSMATS